MNPSQLAKRQSNWSQNFHQNESKKLFESFVLLKKQYWFDNRCNSSSWWLHNFLSLFFILQTKQFFVSIFLFSRQRENSFVFLDQLSNLYLVQLSLRCFKERWEIPFGQSKKWILLGHSKLLYFKLITNVPAEWNATLSV